MRGITLERRLIAHIASGIGALAIIAALLIFLVDRQIDAAVFISLLIGVLGLGLWLALLPDDLRHLISGRQAVYGGNSILISVLFAGIVLILMTLAGASNIAADLTQYRTYSLRPDVEVLVKSMTQPAIVTVFYNSSQLAQQQSESPILHLFSDNSNGLVHVSVVDPDQQPVVARSFGVTQGVHAFVTGVNSDGTADTGTGKIITLTNDYVGEQQIADALLLLQVRGKFKVLFATGDGELNTESGGDAAQIRAGLGTVGMQTGIIDLSKDDIPADTTALVIISPVHDLTVEETNRVSLYMGNGGRLMLMAQPLFYEDYKTSVPNAPLKYTFLQDSSPMTRYLWDNWGLRAQNDIVYDPGSYVDSPYNLLTAKASGHPIMAKDQAGRSRLQALLFLARSWQLADSTQKPAEVLLYPLIETTDKAFGATDIRAVQLKSDAYQRLPQDLSGPFTMAVAAQNTKSQARIVVIGDSQWATNDVVLHYGNAILWSNMMNWLTQFDEKTSVSPTVKPLPLITDTNTLNGVIVLTMVVMPGIVLIVGLLVWRDRARR